MWRGWYSWQDGECRARKGGRNGYSLRTGRRLFSFQDRNWPSLSEKTIWYFEEILKLNSFFGMFIGTLAANSYIPSANPVIRIWEWSENDLRMIWEWRLTWLGILCQTFSQAAHKVDKAHKWRFWSLSTLCVSLTGPWSLISVSLCIVCTIYKDTRILHFEHSFVLALYAFGGRGEGGQRTLTFEEKKVFPD